MLGPSLLHTRVQPQRLQDFRAHHNSSTREDPLPSHFIAAREKDSSCADTRRMLFSAARKTAVSSACTYVFVFAVCCSPKSACCVFHVFTCECEGPRELAMRSSQLLLIALPGWVWGYLSPAPLSGRPHPAPTPPGDRKLPSSRASATTGRISHAQRCRPLFRYGVHTFFSEWCRCSRVVGMKWVFVSMLFALVVG